VSLRGIEIAEDILGLIVDLEDEDLEEALGALSNASSTYGLLWVLSDIRTSGMDLDYYEMKRDVLEFAQKLRNNKHWPIAIVVEAQRKRDKEKVLHE